ncbi:hypothetical protein [Hafnia paralvei]|uniref:hypothetical protein n=1 Tax=Hafnia paralvei TaxID=546367 RepID=UPI0024B8955C|nr:hypothetical protein [Hafnia paralvei]
MLIVKTLIEAASFKIAYTYILGHLDLSQARLGCCAVGMGWLLAQMRWRLLIALLLTTYYMDCSALKATHSGFQTARLRAMAEQHFMGRRQQGLLPCSFLKAV